MEKDESALFEIVRSAAVVFSVISLSLFFALSALPFVTRAGGASRRGEKGRPRSDRHVLRCCSFCCLQRREKKEPLPQRETKCNFSLLKQRAQVRGSPSRRHFVCRERSYFCSYTRNISPLYTTYNTLQEEFSLRVCLYVCT